MLAPPEHLADTIIDTLQADFGLPVTHLYFLPLGADENTAVYRAQTADGSAYFVKVRLADFHAASLTVPSHLYAQGLRQLIPPLATSAGQLWAPLAGHWLILYPYVAGRPGYERGMTPTHWHEFGAAMLVLHTTPLPAELTRTIPHETFTPVWPARMAHLLQQVANAPSRDPVVQALATFLQPRHAELADVISRTQRLAAHLQANPPAFVLCHGDIHGWNLLIDDHDQLFIVDWDTLILAPKERDLMFIGGGHGDSGYRAAEEEALFYGGYGQTPINRAALAYYRFARVLEDIVLFGEQILATDSGEDRQQALVYLQSNFLPHSTLARAYQALDDRLMTQSVLTIVRKE